MSAQQMERGACQRPVSEHPTHHANNPNRNQASSQASWRIVVCTRDALWGRYASEQEAVAVAQQLRRHGFHVRVEADR